MDCSLHFEVIILLVIRIGAHTSALGDTRVRATESCSDKTVRAGTHLLPYVVPIMSFVVYTLPVEFVSQQLFSVLSVCLGC